MDSREKEPGMSENVLWALRMLDASHLHDEDRSVRYFTSEAVRERLTRYSHRGGMEPPALIHGRRYNSEVEFGLFLNVMARSGVIERTRTFDKERKGLFGIAGYRLPKREDCD